MVGRSYKCEDGVFIVNVITSVISFIVSVICIKYLADNRSRFNIFMLICAWSGFACYVAIAAGCYIGFTASVSIGSALIYIPVAIYECLVLYRFALFKDIIWYPRWFMLSNMVFVWVLCVFFVVSALVSPTESNALIIISKSVVSIYAGIIETVTGGFSLFMLYRIRKELIVDFDVEARDTGSVNVAVAEKQSKKKKKKKRRDRTQVIF